MGDQQMAVRIQLRRDTAANWTSNNPTLREGEIGIETDTLKMKVGTGSHTWAQITNYANVVPTNLNTTLNGYVEVGDIGAESGVAGLNGLQNLLIPNDSIIFEGATEDGFETTLTVTDPTADRTITFPDAGGTVALAENVAALSGATFTGNISVPTQITFEGATADSYETIISVTDPTSDRVITLPDLTGTVVLRDTVETITNKSISLGSNTVTSTLAQLNTAVSDADLASLAGTETLTNKTLTSPVINTPTGITKSDVGLANVDNTTDAGKPISTATQTALDLKAPLAAPAFTGTATAVNLTLSGDLIVNGTTTTLNSTTMSVDDKNIELGSVATPSDVTADGGGITLKGTTDKTFNWVDATDAWTSSEHLNLASGKSLYLNGTLLKDATETLTNKTLTSPKINEDVAVTATATELNYVDGVTSAIQTQLDGKVDESLFDTKGDILVASADNTPAKLAAGTNGYILTANSSATNGVEWAAAPISLPSQTGNGGEYLTTDGSTASWAAIPVTSAATTSARGTVYGSTGAYQTILGYQALGGGTFSGAFSTVVMGYQAGYNLGAGEKNVIVGGFAGTANSSGSYNTILGTESAKDTSGGSNNVLLGYQSGYDLSNGSNNILIGSGAQASTSTTSNEVSLGNSSITRFRIPGIGLDFGKAETITANTATTIDTMALSSFTSAEYLVSLKQGSKVRTSKVIVQDDGTNVDMTEFAITETGGTMTGVVVSASVSSTNAILQVTVTDAATTNVTVKFNKVTL